MHITFTMSASSAPKLCVQLTDSDDPVEQRLGSYLYGTRVTLPGSQGKQVVQLGGCRSHGGPIDNQNAPIMFDRRPKRLQLNLFKIG